MDIQLGEAKGAARCLFCHDDLDDDRRKVCLACKAVYHSECAEQCMNVGCRASLEEQRLPSFWTEQHIVMIGLGIFIVVALLFYESDGVLGIWLAFQFSFAFALFIKFLLWIRSSFKEGDAKRAALKAERRDRAAAYRANLAEAAGEDRDGLEDSDQAAMPGMADPKKALGKNVQDGQRSSL